MKKLTFSLLVFAFLTTGWASFAQSITGPTSSAPGTINTYSLFDDVVYTNPNWTTTNGTVTSQTNSGLNHSATIVFDCGTSAVVSIRDGTTVKQTLNVSVTTINLATPSTAFTYANNCGNTVITRTSNPLGLYNWYWQTSASGTDTSLGLASTLTVTSPGTYYLRSQYKGATCVWSASALATSAVTIKVIPNAAAFPQTICTTKQTSVIINNPNGVSGTTFSWTVVQSNVTGGSAGSGSPIVQTLTSTSSGTATYTITPTAAGCAGTTVQAVVSVKPIPTVSATAAQTLFSGQATAITITNPNSVTGTTFGWTVSAPNITGASAGSGSSIAQTLTTTTAPSAAATYTISASANGCSSTTTTSVATVYPIPVVAGTGTYIALGPVTLTSPSGFDTYSWKNSANTQVGTSVTYRTKTPDTYKVTVTKSTASATSAPYVVGTQLASLDMNYLVSNTVMASAITIVGNLPGYAVDTVNQTVDYFDGLGRPIQKITTQGSPLKADIVTADVYDGLGRDAVKYMPFVSVETTGRYKGSPVGGVYTSSLQYNYYNNGTSDKVIDDAVPYATTVFEASPLNRPLQDFGPGQSWTNNNKYIAHSYLVNNHGTSTGQEQIIIWNLDPSTLLPVRMTTLNSGYYPTGTLSVKSTKDEQGNEVREYTESHGKVILKKVALVNGATDLNNTANWTQTYYVYDDLEQLLYVLQPELVKTLVLNGTNPASTDLARFAFQYQYDWRRRMTSKQVPGAGAVYMVYDNRDRLIFTQDANQRTSNTWHFTKYDILNRPVATGLKDTAVLLTQAQMQTVVNTNFAKAAAQWGETYVGSATGNMHGYSNKCYPAFTTGSTADATKYLTVSYYDNYSFVTDLSWGSAYAYLSTDIAIDNTNKIPAQSAANNNVVIGHPTGGRINVLGSTNYLNSIMYYDAKYRTIQVTAQNNKGGWDRTTNVVDFTGRVLKTKTTHHTSTHGTDQVIVHRPVYDHMSRVLKSYHTVNTNAEVLLVQNKYNEIGQLVDKGLYSTDNGSTVKQSVDYRYNIRGWLTSMNNSQLTVNSANNDDANDLFGMELGYEGSLGTGNTGLYNGNISSMKWSTNLALGTAKDVGYNYSYDALNRILGASYLTDNGTWTNPTGQFSESGYSYDQNGNILALTRKGVTGTALDNLTYNYGTSGNQLQYVSDAGDVAKGFVDGNTSGNDYSYDANGNMTYDKNKSLTASNAIQYNHLNLPSLVTKSTGDNIVYTYDATGRKLSQVVNLTGHTYHKTTEYDGEFIYQGDTLQFINHEEGRVVMTGTTPEYQYHLKDHLGNVRMTFTTLTTVKTYTAGFETANQTTEASNFLNYQTGSSHISTVLANAHSGSNSLYLNGGYTAEVGVAKSFSVMPGDVVSIQAYAKYGSPTSTLSNLTAFATALLSAFTLPAPAPGESGTPSSALNTWGIGEEGGWGDGYVNDGQAKVFVTIVIFDRNYNYINVTYQQLQSYGGMSASFTVTQPGYAYVYVSNEEAYLRDVYVDDVSVTYTPSLVVQLDDYYPFGLKFNSYSRENSVPNKTKLFQGQEHIDDLGLNWDSFKYRNHQPDIGRFFGIDPLADKYVYNSPYAFAENKLGLGIELEGLELFPLTATYIFEATPATARPTIMLENPIKTAAEVGGKTAETTGKTGMAENFARGNKVETEQLARNGLEKNTKPIEGAEGKSIPDAMKNEGKSTSEIKNVKDQSLTKQLRIQKDFSEGNGFKPELIINKDAKLSQPLQKGGFDIKTYQTTPVDATKVAPSAAQMKEKVQTPCGPGCI